MRGIVASVLAFAVVSALSPLVSATLSWRPAIPAIPPGGFATITVEGIRHGDRNVPSDVRLRFRSDKQLAAMLVMLDGHYLTQQGEPFRSVTSNPLDLPQWTFDETLDIEVPITGLAPGVHHLEVRGGVVGSSLPIINSHEIWFSVGD